MANKARGVTVSEIVHDKDVPEDVKDLIIPILAKLRGLERQVVGAVELAYRRGRQSGNSRKDSS